MMLVLVIFANRAAADHWCGQQAHANRACVWRTRGATRELEMPNGTVFRPVVVTHLEDFKLLKHLHPMLVIEHDSLYDSGIHLAERIRAELRCITTN